jgi:RNA polymerase sigma-54 factor
MNIPKEYVVRQLRRTFEGQELRVAEALLGQINEAGYLDRPYDDLRAAVAHAAHCTPVEMLTVLHRMQRLDPPGYGAADLCDRLLIQLEMLRPTAYAPPPPQAASATRPRIAEAVRA